MLTVAFDEAIMSRTQVQLWYNQFEDGWEDVNDDVRPGRPSKSTNVKNDKAVKQMIIDDRRITIREVADDISISLGSCQGIFTDILDIKPMATKIVRKLLHF